MSGHTPGPWVIVAREVMEEDGSVYPKHIVGGELERTVCFLEGQYIAEIAVKEPGTHWDTTPQKEANARLIAAAPELLEACQTFAEWLRREEGCGSLEAPWRDKRDTPEGEAAWREWYDENLRLCALAQDQARAAIAKATGEPHG